MDQEGGLGLWCSTLLSTIFQFYNTMDQEGGLGLWCSTLLSTIIQLL